MLLFALDAELTTSHYCHNAQDKKFAKIERYLEIKILIKRQYDKFYRFAFRIRNQSEGFS